MNSNSSNGATSVNSNLGASLLVPETSGILDLLNFIRPKSSSGYLGVGVVDRRSEWQVGRPQRSPRPAPGYSLHSSHPKYYYPPIKFAIIHTTPVLLKADSEQAQGLRRTAVGLLWSRYI